MTQEQVDVLFEITGLIHEHEFFKDRTKEEVQWWVTCRLASAMHVFTKPKGSSWGVLVSQAEFKNYCDNLHVDNSEVE